MTEVSESERLTKLESDFASFKAALSRIEQYIERSGAQGKFTLAHLGVIVAILLAIGGIGVSYVNTIISPLQDKSATSITDRDAMRMQQAINTEKVAILSKVDGQTMEQLKEVETQVKGVYDIANLREAHNKEIIAIMWQQLNEKPYPSVPFFPQPKIMP